MKDISVQLESKYSQIQTLKIKLTRANSWRPPRFVLGRAGRLTGGLVHCWSPQLFFSFTGLCLLFLFSVFPDAFLFDLTLSITSILPQSLFDGVRLRLENFPRIFVVRRSGGPNLVFHWSAA